MRVGVPKETKSGEKRVAATPDSIKRLNNKVKGLEILVESGAGAGAHYPDDAYTAEGAKVVDRKTAYSAEIVLKVHRPEVDELSQMSKGTVVVSFVDPFSQGDYMDKAASAGIELFGLELVPRISRAQSMDALSSQANIAGYRAVIEAASQFGRFMPTMMTAAGSAKPARVIVLGVGVAGLQAIATAKRLGGNVEAFDVRPEVKEQVLSLGAKFIEIDVGEDGSGTGGYAKELSAEGKAKQQAGLMEKLKKADIIITTALIPGRPAPVLVTEEAVKGMKPGTIIVDMAAANGGNCPLSEADKTVVKHGVILIGNTNFLAMMPSDSSDFYARNLVNILELIIKQEDENPPTLNLDLEDEIIAGALATHEGQVRFQKK